jgi:uncharacterized membrane protein YgcG
MEQRAQNLTCVVSAAGLENQTERELATELKPQLKLRTESAPRKHLKDEASVFQVRRYVSAFDAAFDSPDAAKISGCIMVPRPGDLHVTKNFWAVCQQERLQAMPPRRICAAAIRCRAADHPDEQRLQILLLSHHEYALAVEHVGDVNLRTARDLAATPITPEDGTIICSVAGLETLFFGCRLGTPAAITVASALLMDGSVFRGADDEGRCATLMPPLAQLIGEVVDRDVSVSPGTRQCVPAPYREHDLTGAYKGSVVETVVTQLLAARAPAPLELPPRPAPAAAPGVPAGGGFGGGFGRGGFGSGGFGGSGGFVGSGGFGSKAPATAGAGFGSKAPATAGASKAPATAGGGFGSKAPATAGAGAAESN